MKWTSVSLPISELKEYEHNPRRISTKDFNKLVKSLKEDGYHQRIIINKDGTILGGHQRKKALLQAGYKPSDVIDVIMADKQLTPKEIDRINIRDNLPFGEYDFDILANRFDVDELLDFGMPEEWLQNLMGEVPEIDSPESDNNFDAQVWQLGEHKLISMDGDDLDYINGLLKGGSSLVVTVDTKHIAKVIARWEKETKKKAKLVGEQE